WGPDGWLYGCVGQNGGSLVGRPGTPEEERVKHSRGIWRYHPIRQDFEVVGLGPVNPWGLDFNEVGEGFFVNCVLPHLWQMIPGAHYERRRGERDNPYAYARMESITDHLHWGGGRWTSSRGGKGIHNTPGGGHAHTGAMIYLGNNWPEKYRHTIFMGNIHGNRINNDVLERKGSGYVGRHNPDFLHGNHPWFRSLSQKYGPDGGVFMSDWHDVGECHDSDGSHRTSGRIYKIVYGKPNPLEPFDLRAMSDENLVAMQTHRNAWFARHARRILQERAAAGDAMAKVHQLLWGMFEDSRNHTHRIRALWGLWVTGGISENQMMEVSTDDSEDIRSWSVRFMCESEPTPRAIARLGSLARTDRSAKLRMYLASMLQRIPVPQRWSLASALMERKEDVDDPNIPLLLWYGLEPLVALRPNDVLERLPRTRIPLIRRFVARRLVDENEAVGLARVTQFLLLHDDVGLRRDLLTGMTEALRGRQGVKAPRGWTAFYEKTLQQRDSENLALATSLSAVFKEEDALKRLRFKAADRSTDKTTRRLAARALSEAGDTEVLTILYDFLDDPELRVTALKRLGAYDDPALPDEVLKVYKDLSDTEKRLAVDVLASRGSTAKRLLNEIQSGTIKPADVPIHTVRHLQAYSNLSGRLREIWGYIQETSEDKTKLIAEYKARLTPAALAKADPSAGRKVFEQSCAACHRLFGEGGD
ncbi:MAG: PVC-type heme-binding CxxCH protein, partial [Verrucomicrobiota bacterium]